MGLIVAVAYFLFVIIGDTLRSNPIASRTAGLVSERVVSRDRCFPVPATRPAVRPIESLSLNHKLIRRGNQRVGGGLFWLPLLVAVKPNSRAPGLAGAAEFHSGPVRSSGSRQIEIGAEAILMSLPVLRHHDDGSLQGYNHVAGAQLSSI